MTYYITEIIKHQHSFSRQPHRVLSGYKHKMSSLEKELSFSCQQLTRFFSVQYMHVLTL